ncbi:MAG: hypothetical protein M3Z09_18690 [Acidobacteriota bacterium]|nr:hypothetical protein [Acidobacteriota bacterium]
MKRTPALWTGLLAGPVVWLLSLEANFALAPWVCAFHWKAAAYVVSLAAFAITAAAGLIAWRQWRQVEGQRPRAMALGGVMLSAGFLVALLAQSIPQFMMAGCE